MAGAIWVVGELPEWRAGPCERAKWRRSPGAWASESGRAVTGVVVAAPASTGTAAADLAGFVPRVLGDRRARGGRPAHRGRGSGASRDARRASTSPRSSCSAATPDGRDLAGALSALLGWGVLANALGRDAGAETARPSR